MIVTDEMIEKYRKELKQSISLVRDEVDQILALLTQTIDQNSKDIENKI
jgi:hypothetical protein